jgi:hypothetical protein
MRGARVGEGNKASLFMLPAHRDATSHANCNQAGGISSANSFRTIRPWPRSRFALCDIPQSKQQMGGYSAIAASVGIAQCPA